MADDTIFLCLNPCFSGTYSQSQYGNSCCFFIQHVLILVLVEHTLRVFEGETFSAVLNGLNPCFSGTYSQRRNNCLCLRDWGVLILVLVEHTLRAAVMKDSPKTAVS